MLNCRENVDSLTVAAVVAKVVNARGLEPRNTISVLRVQVPFTAIPLRGNRMSELTSSGASSSSPRDDGYDFTRLMDLQSCPPADATPKEGVFFAFHGSTPPDAGDFQTAEQSGAYVDGDPCKRRSNSIFDNLAAIEKKADRLRRKGHTNCRFISAGRLSRESGVTQNDHGHHHSFWACGKTSMHAVFTERVQ